MIAPIDSGSATIYLPACNPKLSPRMRPVLTREEIDSILSDVKNDRMPWIPDRKQRTLRFRQILSRRDTRELLLLADCLDRQKMGKGLSTGELEILHRVEGMVEQEFSFALNISRGEIGQYIRDRL